MTARVKHFRSDVFCHKEAVVSKCAGMEKTPLGMSNYDHEIDEEFEAVLRQNQNKIFGRHSAWNFNALVWFDGKVFQSEVWQYHEVVGYCSAASLKELMNIHNDAYGSE